MYPHKGDRIKDQNGRVGIITDVRDDRDSSGFFARPEAMKYKEAMDCPGMGSQIVITATWWQQVGDHYEGAWADSPLHTRLTAEVVA